jgi:peptidoglycan-associated lipoprotein
MRTAATEPKQSSRNGATRLGAILLLVALAACSGEAANTGKVTSTADLTQPPRPSDSTTANPLGGKTPFDTAANDRILFDYDSAIIRNQDLPTLRSAASWLKQHPTARIMLEGHADERGTREYNLALGEKRAEALERALLNLDVPKGQITGTVSYGKERPAVVGSTEESWSQNRRAVMAVQ